MKFLYRIVNSAPTLWMNKNSNLLLNSFNEKELHLWNGIIKGTITDNEKASKVLYGLPPSTPTFQKFKNAFRYKVDNILLLYTNPKASSFQQAYHLALREQHVLKILLNQGMRNAAIAKAKSLIRKCEKFHFNSIGQDTAKLVWKHYAVFGSDLESFDLYYKKYEIFKQAAEIETKVELAYALTVNYFTTRKALNPQLAEKARKTLSELKKHVRKVNSFRFHIDYFRIALMEKESEGDLKSCIEISKEALQYFEELSFQHNGALTIFRRRLANYHLQLNQLTMAESYIKDLILHSPEKNHIWFLNKEQIFLIQMRSQRYQAARETLNYVTKEKRFISESAEFKDKWKLYKVYIDLLALMGVLASSPKPASIIKQINKLSRYKGDKMGMNLALQICQTLYFYFSGNEDQLGLHIDAIKKYSTIYLKEGNDRSKIFFKMLSLLPLRIYEKRKFDRKIRILREKLNEKSINHVNQATDLEVIPYEDLWSLIVSKDPQKIHLPERVSDQSYPTRS